MLLELFLPLMQFCSVTGAAGSTCFFYLPAVQQSIAAGDQFEEMCYSKMNMLVSLFLWQEEVSMVCGGRGVWFQY